eukprot:1740930-Rhodomonas_salina.1
MKWVARYKTSAQAEHCTVNGSMILVRTSLGLLLPRRGISEGSKSWGKYLFKRTRSPMVTALFEEGEGDTKRKIKCKSEELGA